MDDTADEKGLCRMEPDGQSTVCGTVTVPGGSAGSVGLLPRRYIVRRPDARSSHFDFTLEIEGRPLVWAVPNGPSLLLGDKRLAVHVDEPPASQDLLPIAAGPGPLVWDEGDWEPIGDPADGYARGRVRLRLRGGQMTGEWELVRMAALRRGERNGKQNWLIVRLG